MNRLLLFIILVIFASFIPPEKVYFKKLTKDEGLPSNYVTTVIQDKEGFMWFGTMEGLSRYDGVSFLNLRHSPTQTTSLLNNNIQCITEDTQHNFWIGTQKGLTYFDLNTYKFKRLDSKFNKTIGTTWITSLCMLNKTHLLVATFTQGFYIFDTQNQTVQNFDTKNGFPHNTVRHVLKDKNGFIWLSTDNGVAKFNLQNKQFTPFLKGKKVIEVGLSPQGQIITAAAGDSKLYTINPKNNGVSEQEFFSPQFRERDKHILFDNEGNRWIGVVDGGICYTNRKTNQTTIWNHNRYDINSINSNTPLQMYEDKFGNIWISTFDGGVNLLEKNRKPFIQIKSNYLESGLITNHVRSIFQDDEDNIWIGTKVGGMLSKFNRKTLDFVHYKPSNSPNTLNDEFVFSIAQSQAGSLWIGTLYGGLNTFEKKTGKFSAQRESFGVPNTIASNAIMALFPNDDGKLWIGHAERGLDIYDPIAHTFTNWRNSTNTNSLSDDRIRAIYKDKFKNVWVGTSNGLNLYQPQKQGFKRFLNTISDSTSISDNNILCIWQDKNENLWIGTINGFNLYDYKTATFKSYNRNNGFPANSARRIFDDQDGKLWISTDNGIIKFDPQQKTFRSYTKEDGLCSNEFALYSGYKTKNGELLFGSDNGFVLFNPAEIVDNPIIPQVVITDFKLFNQDVPIGEHDSPLTNHITRTQNLTLTHQQSVITFEFAALNYTCSEKNQYAYKMEGFDNDWNYVGTKRNATYTNLPAGNYVFRVKASNNDGIWNEKGTTLNIRILPPFWKTWWAYTFYILLLALIIYKLRTQTIQRAYQEKEREMEQQKLKLFINISHEFRTPLTLMLNPLDKISSSNNIDEIKSSIQVIKRGSWKLLNLVNQLLDFRKIDLKQARINPKNVDVVNFTKDICNLFEGVAQTKDIELSFDSSLDSLIMPLDSDKYEKIIDNLLSNALKFTDTGGKIVLSISKKTYEAHKTFTNYMIGKRAIEFVEIRVADTGIGISKEDINHIFDRFYQIDQSKVGTGIGLNYAKSLVELHQGQLVVESKIGEGSIFTVSLPINEIEDDTAEILTTKSDTKIHTAAIESLHYDIENTDSHAISDKDAQTEVEEALGYKKMILIVEDNKGLRKQIVSFLEEDYVVKEAANGLEGLEKVNKYLPDLIISDIMMPKMDGIELCKKVKSDMNTSHIPVLLLTAKSNIESKIEGFETGADEYVAKPFNMDLLQVRIRNLMMSRTILKDKYFNSKLFASAKEFTTNNLDENFLERATQIVMENIENPDFSLTELRDKVGISRTNLFNKIQALTGNNPSSFVRTIRLKYAAQLLEQGNVSVKDVCFKCGFNSPAYFIKTFRELYGKTPKEYGSHGKDLEER